MGSFKSGHRTFTVFQDRSAVCRDTPVVCQDRSLAFSTVVVAVDAIIDVVVFFAAMSGKSGTFDVPFKTGRSRITDDQSKMANDYTITSCLADGSN